MNKRGLEASSAKTLQLAARTGYGARGVVYCLVGGLAVLAAIGTGGETGGSRNALQTLLGQPLGKILLGLISLGLVFFAIWRVMEALADADRRGTSWQALGKRAAYLVSAAIYGGLAVFSINLMLGRRAGSANDDAAARDWTAWLLEQPFGQWLVAAIGLSVAATGFAFMRKGWHGDVTRDLSLPANARTWVPQLGRAGYLARGIVFVIIGGFLVLAAINGNSSEARGIGGALESLQSQPYGWVLLGVTALGLVAFGIFGLAQARYRVVRPPDFDAPLASAAALARKRM